MPAKHKPAPKAIASRQTNKELKKSQIISAAAAALWQWW